MDSITQATLGAAVGHLCWQEKLGRKALVAGALIGTLPDLDIVLYPLLDEVQRLYWHRGESHSVWFLLIGSIGIGWLLQKNYRLQHLGNKLATVGVFLIISTHVLIDLFNTYGTQLLAPVSRNGFALYNMFIIDPLFTLPLLAGCVSAYCIANKDLARKINITGVFLATLYASWSLSSQSIAHETFRRALAEQNISVDRQITSPAPFTTLLWRHVAETSNGYVVGYWSFFDNSEQQINFHHFPRNASVVDSIRTTRTFQAIEWFSQGWWFVADSDDQTAKIVDLRFSEIPTGSGQQFTQFQWPFAWKFNLDPDKETRLKATLPDLKDPIATLRLLLARIKGEEGWWKNLE